MISHLGPDLLVERQAGAGGHKPTVAQSALVHVPTIHALHKQLRIVANILEVTKYIYNLTDKQADNRQIHTTEKQRRTDRQTEKRRDKHKTDRQTDIM